MVLNRISEHTPELSLTVYLTILNSIKNTLKSQFLIYYPTDYFAFDFSTFFFPKFTILELLHALKHYLYILFLMFPIQNETKRPGEHLHKTGL